MWWYLIAVLICLLLTIYDVECLFICFHMFQMSGHLCIIVGGMSIQLFYSLFKHVVPFLIIEFYEFFMCLE